MSEMTHSSEKKMQRWIIPWIAAAFLFASSAASAQPRSSDEKSIRKTALRWIEVKGARLYEVQISSSRKMFPLVDQRKVRGVETQVELASGVYYFRVRAIDAAGDPGAWSEISGLTVNSSPPKLVFPERNQKFVNILPKGGVRFRWNPGIENSAVIQILDQSGVLLERKTARPELSWRPEEPGEYAWRVGYETLTEPDWSEQRTFTIESSALPDWKPPRDFMLFDPVDVQHRLWLMAGYVPSATLSYYNGAADVTRTGESAALAYGLGYSRLFPRRMENAWRWSLHLGVGLRNHVIQKTSIWNLRFHGRLRFQRSIGVWRVGPYVGGDRYRIALSTLSASGGVSTPSTTWRNSATAGVVFESLFSDGLMLGASAGLMQSFSGTSPAGDALKNSLDPEFNAWTYFRLSTSLLATFEFRSMIESATFTSGGARESSSSMHPISFSLGLVFIL